MAPQVLKKFEAPLNKFFPGEMARTSPALTGHTADTLTLDGQTIKIHVFEGGEHELATALELPDQKALFIADLVYNRVHPWLNELDVTTVLTHVERLAGMNEVETFYPGPAEPFKKDYLPVYVKYVNDFLAEVPQAKDSPDPRRPRVAALSRVADDGGAAVLGDGARRGAGLHQRQRVQQHSGL